MSGIQKLKYFANGKWHDSKTTKYLNIYDPSMGDVIVERPCCFTEEANSK